MRLATLGTLLVTGFVVACVRAQPREAMTVERLRDNLFVVAGEGGNTAVLSALTAPAWFSSTRSSRTGASGFWI